MSASGQVFTFRRNLVVLAAVSMLGVGLVLATSARAADDGPGVGTAWTVTVGDSYISGEAGRWAGNTEQGEAGVDALGPTAYNDNAGHTAETIPGCHRSRSDEVYIGGGVNGLDLACSGARTTTFTDTSNGHFKPGVDFYDDGAGHQGQARLLQLFAASHNVKMVALSIGGNNFDFAGIVTTCIEDFLLSPSWWPNYCNDDPSVTANFTAANVAAQTAAIRTSILNLRDAMRGAGYAESDYTILVQDYPSPIPAGPGFRYPQTGFSRQAVGGCGFWNNDADWANNTALPTINGAVKNAATQAGLANVKVLELASAFNGRRLCENTVGHLEEVGYTSWSQAGAADRTEWVDEVRTLTTVLSDYQVQEDLHPNYWAQLALRNCVRQAYNAGAPKAGTCTIAGTGLTSRGEPSMSLH
jgi:hypothetical protein